MRRICLLVLLISLILQLSIMPTRAQIDELGLSLRPAIVDITGATDSTVTKQITIQNTSSEPVGITVGSRTLLPNDPEIDQQKRQLFDASSWIQPLQKDLLMAPGDIETAGIEVVIPADASPGGHYALITFTPVKIATDDAGQTLVKTQPEVTSLALITVPGDIVESGYATTSRIDRIQLNKLITSQAAFYNDGNVHVLPTMRATVRRSNGQAIETIPVVPQLSLPNTIKTITAEWDPNGRYGRFYIDFEFDFGTPTQTTGTQSAIFLVLPPWTTMLFWASLLGVLAVTIRLIWPQATRRLHRRKGIRRLKRKKTTKPRPAPPAVAPRTLDVLARDRELKSTTKRQHLLSTQPKTAKSSKKKVTKITVK